MMRKTRAPHEAPDFPIWRQPDFMQVFVRIGLNGFRKLVEHVQRFVQLTPLMARCREHLVES
jgi:hypothetical protein